MLGIVEGPARSKTMLAELRRLRIDALRCLMPWPLSIIYLVYIYIHICTLIYAVNAYMCMCEDMHVYIYIHTDLKTIQVIVQALAFVVPLDACLRPPAPSPWAAK